MRGVRRAFGVEWSCRLDEGGRHDQSSGIAVRGQVPGQWSLARWDGFLVSVSLASSSSCSSCSSRLFPLPKHTLPIPATELAQTSIVRYIQLPTCNHFFLVPLLASSVFLVVNWITLSANPRPQNPSATHKVSPNCPHWFLAATPHQPRRPKRSPSELRVAIYTSSSILESEGGQLDVSSICTSSSSRCFVPFSISLHHYDSARQHLLALLVFSY